MEAADLIEFEKSVAESFQAGEIGGPVHLSGGNEEQLISVFRHISRDDWVFSNWRNHYHALLHGIHREKVMAEILAGRGMNMTFPEHRFYSSAIVGGALPIAVGVAYALKMKNCHRKVWCFVGDMAASTGIYHEASEYAAGHDLPLTFVIEDNGLSTNAPTEECWGRGRIYRSMRYHYKRVYPHYGVGKAGQF